VTAPVAAGERLDVLDVMRGIAVLGILLVNIDAFIGYGFSSTASMPPPRGARFDDLTAFAAEFLVQGKFYCLFSFMFGVGFSVFVQRAAARGHDAAALFKRRLAGLLVIGLIHSLLIWFGDILTTYAVIGFALVPFLRKSDRQVLRAAVAWLAAPVPLYLLLLIATQFVPQPQLPRPGELPPLLAHPDQALAHGGYVDVLEANVLFTIGNVVRRFVLMFFPRVFGMFLLGFYAGRANLFAHLDTYAPLLRRIALFGFTIGLPLAFAGAALGDSGSPRRPTLMGLVEMIAESIATPGLALAYGATICLLFRRFRAPMIAIAPVGRMALTSYLTHSIAGVVVFYGIGFGYVGRVSLTVSMALCVSFWLLQIAVSRIWLSFAQFGPAEWLWRCFTYRRRFRLLR
jgi:uncharacterized protein